MKISFSKPFYRFRWNVCERNWKVD